MTLEVSRDTNGAADLALIEFHAWASATGRGPQLQKVVGYRIAQKDRLKVSYRLDLQFYGGGGSSLLRFESSAGARFHLGGPEDVKGCGLTRSRWVPTKRPIELFLRSHFAGSRIVEVSREVGFQIAFQNGNVLRVHTGRKGQVLQMVVSAEARASERAAAKSVAEIFDLSPANEVTDSSLFKASSRESDRIQRAIEKVKLELEKKASDRERECAQWIVENQSLEVPAQYLDLVQEGWVSIGEATEKLFAVAKRNLKKRQRTQSRLNELELELRKLNSKSLSNETLEKEGPAKKVDSTSLLRQAKAKGRTVHLSDQFTLYIGKSASENLSLLRRSQPFDLWFHIKDEPGAHGILRRPRGVEPSDRDLMRAAQWLLFHSLKGKRAEMSLGQPFDIWVAECRHVRPIKGDRLGRVQHDRAQVLRVIFQRPE